MDRTFAVGLCSAALTAAFSIPAAASSTDIVDHGTYLTDTLSGLDWLDVMASVNMSYDQVTAQLGAGGAFEGWHYATGEQLNTLLNHFTNESNPYPRPIAQFSHDPSQVDGLINMLGSTIDPYYQHYFGQPVTQYYGWAEGSYKSTYGLIADVPPEYQEGHYYASILFDLNGNFGPEHSYSRIPNSYEGNFYADYFYGSFLVRTSQIAPVPEPETYSMLLAGLGLIGGVARRRKAKQ